MPVAGELKVACVDVGSGSASYAITKSTPAIIPVLYAPEIGPKPPVTPAVEDITVKFFVPASADDTPEIIYVAIDYKYYDLCIFNFNVPVPLITRCHSCFGINMG